MIQKRAVIVLGISFLLVSAMVKAAEDARWYKGNLHSHSLWSDGDDYPEMIADWYKAHGYHFLALSDHNILSKGEAWIDLETSKGGLEALEKYRQRFGSPWVEERRTEGRLEVRLKTLEEFQTLFDEPGRFIMLQSEEISDGIGGLPIHVNASNLQELIPPQGGTDVVDVIQSNVDAVIEQGDRTGELILPHLNHPNFGWAVTAEQLSQIRRLRFFEVYNGHRFVNNFGDPTHVDLDRMWDIVLTKRMAEQGRRPLYGLAVDDGHNYHLESAQAQSTPGRGWIMVRARNLSVEALLSAMEAGDMYASTGVRLEDIRETPESLTIKIDPEPGVTYQTRFIGTRKGYDRKSSPVLGADGSPLPVTRHYSEDIGQVLAEVEGVSPSYRFKGDEIYVRAKIESSKPKENYFAKGEMETAWTQPVVFEDKGWKGYTAAPKIEPGGGVFSGPITVSLSGPPKARIRYTLDGSVPSKRSRLYRKPFVVGKHTRIRALARSKGLDWSVSTKALFTVLKPIVLPGRIQAEEYEKGGEGVGYHDTRPGNRGGAFRRDDVDLAVTKDKGGGFLVGWIDPGEWLAFEVKVLETDTYDFTVRLASASEGTKTLHVEVDGKNATGQMSFDDASGWQSWVDVKAKGIRLTAGPHQVRIHLGTGGFNINYLDVTPSEEE